ncbi:hypothetical protein BU16DRAFT_530677 [Lophium mytilinum]|uniref:YCII-related domain-containing protein n=1 Tax=Lophium mytilinum TaxID=390894 RepID=A0A6A6QG02_9PEZI|nr:hypothetical protein BU16DRAFT_530677 [Lophium mytilinum]
MGSLQLAHPTPLLRGAWLLSRQLVEGQSDLHCLKRDIALEYEKPCAGAPSSGIRTCGLLLSLVIFVLARGFDLYTGWVVSQGKGHALTYATAGAMLEEPIKEGETPKMKGSAMLCVATTQEEVLERLRRDIYVTEGVWDLEKIQVIPFKSAVRKAL